MRTASLGGTIVLERLATRRDDRSWRAWRRDEPTYDGAWLPLSGGVQIDSGEGDRRLMRSLREIQHAGVSATRDIRELYLQRPWTR